MCDFGARQEMPVSTTNDAPRVGYEIDCGDLRPDLTSDRDVGGKTCLDGVGESGEHCISHWVLQRDADACFLGGFACLGVGDDVGSVRGGPEN